jgi:hypothetical protein
MSQRHLFRFRSHHAAGSGSDGIPGAGQQEVIHQKFLHQPSEKGMEVPKLLFLGVGQNNQSRFSYFILFPLI